jgi:hypothetical protein
MKTNIKFGIGALLAAMLLLSMVFVPAVSAQVNKNSESDTGKQIRLCLDKTGGILIDQSENKKAYSHLTGTIDENNHLLLSGTIVIDGKSRKVDFEGNADKIFIGWNVPEDAKPIYSDIHGKTMIRYEGATRMYACTVELKDKKNQFDLKGEFFEDGSGGLVGKAVIAGTEYKIALRGDSVGLVEEVINDEDQTVEALASKTLDVPQRSQWELYYNGHGYDAASSACGHTVVAMLEEYWTSNHPTIWSIWTYNPNPMSPYEAETYFGVVGVPCAVDCCEGTLAENINDAKAKINLNWPFYMTEESQWGNCHAVVVRGYYDAYTDFVLNDPNTWNGNYVMHWYTEEASFNFEDNVYTYVGGSDEWTNGYISVC